MIYKTVFIDWDGTLTNSRFWDRWSSTEKYTHIQNTIFTDSGSDSPVYKWMTGDMSSHDIVKLLSKTADISYAEIFTELQYSVEHMSFINNDDISAIQKLRKNGSKIIVATDNWIRFPNGRSMHSIFHRNLTDF